MRPAWLLLLTTACQAAEWRGINYAPRGHPYFRMLYDWHSADRATGLPVRQLAATDMELLQRSGFNTLHVYLWDQPTFADFHRKGSTKQLEPAGFAFPDPRLSPRRQWEALDEFIALAGRHGLGVIPHFVHTPFNEDMDVLSATAVEQRAEEIARWASVFIEYLGPRHKNISAWGMLYASEPAPADDPAQPNPYSRLWRKVYAALKRKAGETPLITFLFLPSRGRESGYRLDAAVARERYASMRRHLSFELGEAAGPDLVYTYVFGPDPEAIESSLRELTTGEGAVPAERLFVAEYGISSPFGSSDAPVMALGENGAPTVDLQGQSEWLRASLCAFQALGINKTAYWTLYDAPALWSSPVWSLPPGEASLNGHWGLAFEDRSRGFKPAWSVLAAGHNQLLDCGAPRPPAGTFLPDPEPGIDVRSVVSAASGMPASWQPGSLITMIVSGLQGLPALWRPTGFPYPRSQFGIRVVFGGAESGAFLEIEDGGKLQRLRVQVPWETRTATTALTVEQDGRTSALLVNRNSGWSDFFRGADGNALAVHERSGEAATPADPARAGQTVLLYLTNLKLRPVSTLPVTGHPDATGALIRMSDSKSGYRLRVGETLHSLTDATASVRLLPGAAGVYQMRLTVPRITEPATAQLWYLECLSTHGVGLSCLGTILFT
ncbi:MAG: hypothetical protein FJW39_06465 [Acidobacteria bacterium]|nr:hypothetical protein [Acidobacteriota bacterium]